MPTVTAISLSETISQTSAIPTGRFVVNAVEGSATYSDRDKSLIVSSWNMASEWFGIDLDTLIAHPRNVGPRFAKLSPGGLGVKKKTIANAKYYVMRSIREVLPGCENEFKTPFSPVWCALDLRIGDRYLRASVRCILRLGSARGLTPDQVDDAFSGEVLKALILVGARKRPLITHQNATRCWNKLCDIVPGWPKTKLTVPKYGSSYVLPASAFRADIISAIETFLVRRTTVDPFELDTPIDVWSAATVTTYRKLLLRYLTLLVIAGRDTDAMRSFDDICSFADVDFAFRAHGLQSRAKGRKTAANMATLLAQIAEQSLAASVCDDATRKARQEDISRIKQLSNRLRTTGVTSDANRTRLAPLKDEANLAKLFLLPFALEREVAKLKSPIRPDALLMQLAVALMILTFCPLRIASLCAIRIDRHLTWSRPNIGGKLTLEFAEGELKNGEPASLPLPIECARIIRVYLSRFRPLLATSDSPFLFCGAFDNTSKLTTVLSTQIKRIIFDRTGFDVNPHLYRHVVHLVVLKRFPGAFAMIARILTHRSIATTIKNYSHFDAELSMTAYQKLVRDVQGGASEIGTPSSVGYHMNQGVDYE